MIHSQHLVYNLHLQCSNRGRNNYAAHCKLGPNRKHYMQDHGVAQSINICSVFTEIIEYAEFTVNWVLIK